MKTFQEGKLVSPGDYIMIRLKGYYDLSLWGDAVDPEIILERSFNYKKKSPDSAHWGPVAAPILGPAELQCSQLAGKAWVRVRLSRITSGEVNVRIGRK